MSAEWLKIVVFAGVVVVLAGCKSDGTDMDDFYDPTAHYERHPIIVTKTGAHAKKCGAFPEDLADTGQNDTYANFGCSQQNNIAAMVADPNDFERPRRQTPADAMRRIKAYDKYRAGEQIGSADEKKQVELSDVAKN